MDPDPGGPKIYADPDPDPQHSSSLFSLIRSVKLHNATSNGRQRPDTIKLKCVDPINILAHIFYFYCSSTVKIKRFFCGNSE